MPDFKAHSASGIIVYFLGSLILAIALSFENGCACFVGSILPDLLEPAFHWDHRRFFHSWLMVGILAITAYIAYSNEYYLIFSGCCGYISHLLMDSKTKMGLPTGFDR